MENGHVLACSDPHVTDPEALLLLLSRCSTTATKLNDEYELEINTVFLRSNAVSQIIILQFCSVTNIFLNTLVSGLLKQNKIS